MLHTFNGFVVGVYKPAFQRRLREAIHVNCIAVVLGSNVAPVSFQIKRRLILATVTILHFVSVATLRQRQNLCA